MGGTKYPRGKRLTCPECGHELGLASQNKCCSSVCDTLRRVRRRRERWRRFQRWLYDFPWFTGKRPA